MDIFLYIMIFIAGTVFGSFFSLAVYRIPRKENITYVQSHCVSCNHKLAPKDLIPILSYVLLKGRCRYCNEKVRSRYILLEVTSGLTFLLVALFMKINIFSSIFDFVNLFIIYLFVTSIFIIGGIDKENLNIPDNVLIYSIVISIIKIMLNAFLGINAVNNLVGFLVIPLFLLVINIALHKKEERNFEINIGDIKYIAVIGLFLGFIPQLIVILFSFIIAVIVNFIHKYKKVPMGYYLSIATILFIIFGNYFNKVIDLIFI